MMTHPTQTPALFLRRDAELEQLVRELVDRTAFGPVAITTGLGADVLGFGKSTLARAVAADPRVREAFPDGIYWVSLHPAGDRPLTVLERMGLMDRLIAEITGKPSGITDPGIMERSLHDLLHPLRALLVLDDVTTAEAMQPFLHSGPGGATMIVAYDDSALPFEARRVTVDTFDVDEGIDALLAGVPQADALFKPGLGEPAGVVDSPLGGIDPTATQGSSDATLAGRDLVAHVERLEHRKRLVEQGMTPETAAALQGVSSRLNRWPLLVGLANGLLRAMVQEQPGQSIIELLRAAEVRLDRRGLARVWSPAEPAARMAAARAAVDAVIDTLPPEQRQHCANLAVFPAGDWVPLAAAARMWGAESASTLAEVLADRRLIDLNGQGKAFRLHPVVRECFAALLIEGELAKLHARLVESYSDTPADDGYVYPHLPRHLLAAGRSAHLTDKLFNFDWLAAYLESRPDGKTRPDLYALVEAYDLALASGALDTHLSGLRMVREAVRLSIPSLARDPSQFAAQMLGRLLNFKDPRIQAMLQQAAAWDRRAWLRPMTVCFTTPGGDELRVLKGHTNWVTGVTLLPDSLFAMSVSLDGTMRLWNLSIGQQVYSVEAHPGGVFSVAVSPDGRKAATGGSDGKVRVWDVRHGLALMTIDAHKEAVSALAITPDGSLLISAGDDKAIRLWEFDTGAHVIDLLGHTEPVRSLAITPDGRTLISGGMDDTLRIWAVDDGHLMHQLPGHTSWVRAITTTPDGYYAISAGWDRTLRVWDMFTGEEVLNIDVAAAQIYAIAVTEEVREGTQDGKSSPLVLCGAGDGTLRVLDFYSGEELLRLTGHTGGINSVAVAQGGQYAVTGADDGTLRLWDLQAARRANGAPGEDDVPVPLLVRLPGGRRALSGSADGTLKIWDLATGQVERVLAGHSGGAPVVAVDDAGHWVLTGAPDQTVRLWNLDTGEQSRLLAGHPAAVSAVSITPGGGTAVSGDISGALFVWDLSGADEPLAVFHGEGAITGCQIDADGRTVAVSEAGGKMYFLEIKR